MVMSGYWEVDVGMLGYWGVDMSGFAVVEFIGLLFTGVGCRISGRVTPTSLAGRCSGCVGKAFIK